MVFGPGVEGVGREHGGVGEGHADDAAGGDAAGAAEGDEDGGEFGAVALAVLERPARAAVTAGVAGVAQVAVDPGEELGNMLKR